MQNTTHKKNGLNADKIEKAMQYTFNYIEQNSYDGQFSLTDLMDKFQCFYCPHVQTVKAQLLKMYGNGIVIAISLNKASTVCLRSSGSKLLSDF